MTQEIETIEKELKAEIAKVKKLNCENSLAEFTKHAWHIIEPGIPLKWNWHLIFE